MTLEVNAADEIKVPKVMSDSKFTQVFLSANEGVGYVSDTAVLGNTIMNILLSGSMQFLWGLIHSMQMIGHLPLINVMIPANVEVFF